VKVYPCKKKEYNKSILVFLQKVDSFFEIGM